MTGAHDCRPKAEPRKHRQQMLILLQSWDHVLVNLSLPILSSHGSSVYGVNVPGSSILYVDPG